MVRPPHRAAIVTATVGCALSVVTSCMLTTDFSGIVGTPTDAGNDADEVSNNDAGVDSGGGDSAPKFCASSTHTFCADFDEGNLQTGWTQLLVDPGSSGAFAVDASISPPASFAAMAHVGDAGAASGVVLIKQFPASTLTSISAGFDVRIEACAPQTQPSLLYWAQTDSAGYSHGIYFDSTTNDVTFQTFYPVDGSSQYQTHLVGHVTPGVWLNVQYTFTLSATDSQVSVQIQPTLGGTPVSYTGGAGPAVQKNLVVDLGLYEPSAPCAAVFDNVFVDVVP